MLVKSTLLFTLVSVALAVPFSNPHHGNVSFSLPHGSGASSIAIPSKVVKSIESVISSVEHHPLPSITGVPHNKAPSARALEVVEPIQSVSSPASITGSHSFPEPSGTITVTASEVPVPSHHSKHPHLRPSGSASSGIHSHSGSFSAGRPEPSGIRSKLHKVPRPSSVSSSFSEPSVSLSHVEPSGSALPSVTASTLSVEPTFTL